MSLIPEHLPVYGNHYEGASFSDTVLGADGCVYGIPLYSWRFIRLDPKDDSMEEFGPEFVTYLGFGPPPVRYGVLANDGFIYVLQHGSKSMLKINTNKGESNGLVETFEVEFPRGYDGLPRPRCSGALGPDGSLYFPFSRHRIMRFDPVSRRITDPFPWKSPVAVAGRINIHCGRLVILPQPRREFHSDDGDDEIIYNMDLQTFSGKLIRMTSSSRRSWKSYEGGAFDRDGNHCFLNYRRQVVKLDPWTGRSTNEYTPCHGQFAENVTDRCNDFGSPCLGSDGCIYWPPKNQDRILKYDPYTSVNTVEFVGTPAQRDCRWSSGVTAPNGKTYFLPYMGSAKQVLVVDPLGKYKADFFERIETDPFNLGSIFEREEESNFKTTFDMGIEKFGMDAMLQMLDECILKNKETFDRLGCLLLCWPAFVKTALSM